MTDTEKKKTVYNITVFADNFQFQLQDQVEDCEYPEHWNDGLLTQLYVVGEKLVGIGTVRDLDIDLRLEIFEEPMTEKELFAKIDLSEYDHAVQCNIDIPSGKLLVTGCTTDYEEAAKITLPPGRYGMRILWKDLDSSDDLGFEGEDEYMVQLWPNTEFEERILKNWSQIAFHLNPYNN